MPRVVEHKLLNNKMIGIREDELISKQRKTSPNQTKALKIIHILTTTLDRLIEYFITEPEMKADRVTSAETTLGNDEYNDVFNGIWCFKGTFPQQVKYNVKP